MARVHAVLVGINTYQRNASPAGWKELHCPEADTAIMKSALEQCGWQSGELQVQQYTGSRASHEVIKPALESVLSDSAPEDELVVIFFAGHAKCNAAGTLYLALYNTDPTTLKKGLSVTDLRKWLDRSRAREAIVILDCCYSGAFESAGSATADLLMHAWENPTQQRLAAGRSRAVLTSSWHHQLSSERSFGPDGHGVFTEFVVRGLTLADPLSLNASGEVDVDSLHRYVLLKMEEEGIGQSPLRVTWGGKSPVLKHSQSARSGAEDKHVQDPRSNTVRKIAVRSMWSRQDFANSLLASDLAPAGNPVAIATMSNTAGEILLLSARDGKSEIPLRKLGENTLIQLAISPDSRYVGVLTSIQGTADYELRLLPTSARDAEVAFKLRDIGVASRIRFSPDSQLVAVCGANGQVQVYSIQAGQPVGNLVITEANRIRDVAFVPAKKGETIVVPDGQHRVIVWNLGLEAETRGGRARKAAAQEEIPIAEDPWFIELLDEKTMACATRDGRLHLLGIPDGVALAAPINIGRAPTTFASSPTHDAVACGATNGDVHVVLRERWETLSPHRFHTRISDLAFSPQQDNRLLAAATAAGDVHLWNYMTGETVSIVRSPVVGETFVRFSADGSRLLIHQEEGKTLELWELAWEVSTSH